MHFTNHSLCSSSQPSMLPVLHSSHMGRLWMKPGWHNQWMKIPQKELLTCISFTCHNSTTTITVTIPLRHWSWHGYRTGVQTTLLWHLLDGIHPVHQSHRELPPVAGRIRTATCTALLHLWALRKEKVLRGCWWKQRNNPKLENNNNSTSVREGFVFREPHTTHPIHRLPTGKTLKLIWEQQYYQIIFSR